jgi:nitroreductase
LDTYEAISTKLDIREFAPRHVEGKIKTLILEAARLTGSSMNSQHWRFILVQDPGNLAILARDSSTGSWVKGVDFAVIVSVNLKIPGSVIDAGRATQDMQLAAWSQGVASGVFTGMKKLELRKDFGIPEDLEPAIVVGFGYPRKKLLGRKNRKPLSELAFLEKYGSPLGSLGSQ